MQYTPQTFIVVKMFLNEIEKWWKIVGELSAIKFDLSDTRSKQDIFLKLRKNIFVVAKEKKIIE